MLAPGWQWGQQATQTHPSWTTSCSSVPCFRCSLGQLPYRQDGGGSEHPQSSWHIVFVMLVCRLRCLDALQNTFNAVMDFSCADGLLPASSACYSLCLCSCTTGCCCTSGSASVTGVICCHVQLLSCPIILRPGVGCAAGWAELRERPLGCSFRL